MVKRTPSSAKSRTVWNIACQEAGLLLLLAVFSTAALWAIHPDQLPLQADPTFYELELTAPLINASQALAYYEIGEHLFIDVRSNDQATDQAIPGTFIIREASLDNDLAANLDFLFPEDKVILYGNSDLLGAANMAARLQERGFQDLVILKGGLKEWVAAGGPVGNRSLPEQEEIP